MQPATAVKFAGGRQVDLIRVFADGGIRVTKQSVSDWCKAGKFPALRQYQLRTICPKWFRNGVPMPKPVKNPKPRLPPANLASSKAKPRGKGSKMNPKGAPFRPGVNGDQDTKI